MNVTEPKTAVTTSPSVVEPARETKPRRSLRIFIIALVLILLAVGGYFAWQKFGPTGGPITGTPFATQKVNDLTVTLIHPKGQLIHGRNDFLIEFRDTNGELVDVGSVRFALDMNMPGMVMHSTATIKPTGTPGQYRASIKPDMAGDWTVKLEYDGPRGKGAVSFPVNVATSAAAAKAPQSSAAPIAKVELNDEQRKAAQEFFAVADAVSASLAADKVEDFNTATGKLPAVVLNLRAAFNGHAWQNLVQQIESAASLPQAKSLDDARKSFYPLTARVSDFAKAARQQSDAFGSVKIFKCPMAPKAGQTSFWIQLQAPLRNPFYGAEMLDCGSEGTP